MLRFVSIVLLCASSWAQTAVPDKGKPSAKLDKALRARVTEFYTLILNHQYRQAEALVAEDTKDLYYDSNKPQITKFDLEGIQYFNHFTRAKAATKTSQKVAAPGFPAGEWSLTTFSLWKLEKGNWFWYIDQSSMMSPAGVTSKRSPKSAAPPPGGAAAATAGVSLDNIPKTVDFALNKVKPDKDSITIAPGGTAEITITNGSMGYAKLLGPNAPAGVEGKLDRVELQAGQKAVLTLHATKDAKSGVLYLTVMPTGETVPIRVEVK